MSKNHTLRKPYQVLSHGRARWRVNYVAYAPPEKIIPEWCCEERPDGTFEAFELSPGFDYNAALWDPTAWKDIPWVTAAEALAARRKRRFNIADDVKILTREEYRRVNLVQKRLAVTLETKAKAVAAAEELGRQHEEFRKDWEADRPSDITFHDFKTWTVWRARYEAFEAEMDRAADAHQERIARRQDEAVRLATAKTMIQVATELISVSGRWEEGKRRPLKPNYVRKLQNYVHHLEDSGFATKALPDVSLPEVMAWWAKWTAGQGGGTAYRYHLWLCKLGKYARKAKYWPENLFEDLDRPPKSSGRSKKVWSLEEIDKLWMATRKPQEAALLVLLRCGLRQGETIALRENDIDLVNCTIRIRYSMGRKNIGGAERGKQKLIPWMDTVKTDGSKATLKIPRMWMDVLVRSLEHSKSSDIACVVEADGRGQRFVVSNKYGACLTDTASTRRMQGIIRRAKIKVEPGDATWHSWRYTLCADLVSLGANDEELKKLMRHTDVTLTKREYASARKDKAYYKPWIEKIDDVDDYLEVISQFDAERRKVGAATGV